MSTPSVHTLAARATGDANPTTPTYTDDLQWMTAYLTIHMLSANSRVYMYILWCAVAAVLLVCTALHLSPARRSSLAARWNKWAIRRRTWRGKHIANLAARKGTRLTPRSLPANGQILTLIAIFVAALALSFVGPDYLAPTAPLFSFQTRDLVPRAIYDINWYTQYQPTYTISKAWWTAGGRTGLIAFALLPLCVLFALKSPPFAILALPFTVQMHFDKLSWLHRWTGYLIYLLTVLHVGLWSVQLATEKRERTGKVAYTYAFGYQKFIFGWIAFGSMTLLIICSLYPIRRYHYESFYIMHVILIPCTLIMSALHHPPVGQWCWAALAVWIGERAYRAVWWLNANGYLLDSIHAQMPPPPQPFRIPKGPSNNAYPPAAPPPPPLPDVPPPGYARAELLAGATTRLTMLPAGPLSWAPGQHFLINVPAVAPYPITHPFTVASAEGGPLVFLIRAKDGWTRDLWDFVAKKSGNTTVRMFVEGPFGSAVRAHWGRHATVVIVVGGVGVAYGLSVLAHVCEDLVRGKGATRRIRFVWLMREYSHLTWCATELRRYMEMVPPPALEVSMFVTGAMQPLPPVKPPKDKLDALSPKAHASHLPSPLSASTSYSPTPYTPSASPGPSEFDVADAYDVDTYVDLSYYTGEFGDEESRPGAPGENYTRDLTDFEGDEGGDSRRLSGEARLSRRVQRAGRRLRAQSRAIRMSTSGFQDIMPDEDGRMPDAAHLAQARQKLGSRGSTAELLGEDSELAYARASKYAGEVDLGAAPPRISLAPQLPALIEDSDDERSIYGPESPMDARASSSSAFGNASQYHLSSSQLASQMASSSRGSSTLIDSDSRPSTPWSAFGDEKHLLEAEGPRLLVGSEELRDVARVSEFARPGKPRIDRILADEVEKSRGSVVVACCGPTSLSAMVRKAVAQQLRPDRISKGDPRGMIELHTEDFGY
ncbi:hypothetical protein K523DRAFT_331596 [Schizophyllum commune Tattone D]|nr:hypothetical protein K523DRAFT_331596 [Schizophyllum commune Tattone D]